MTSPTGNNRRQDRGFSFFEVMVTTAILSFGLVMIYKAFFISLGFNDHLAHRLSAITLLDNKIYELQRLYEEKHLVPLNKSSQVKSVMINNKRVDFEYDIDFKPIAGLEDMYRADITLSWAENNRDIRLSRSVYISDPKIAETK